ncbi:MAG TPA: histidinol dehydrogenase, partial [Trueperaceae bacterium]
MQIVRGMTEARRAFAGRGGQHVDEAARHAVTRIVEAVRQEGEEALRRYSQQFDGIALDDWRVPPAAFEEAEQATQPELASAIRLAAERIRAYYEQQPRGGFLRQAPGELLGQLIRPLERVACYVPAGTAPLFSTVLMSAIPARVAGVEEVLVATPPRKDGSVAPEILIAARQAGVTDVYRIGGAQAVAALAYGTQTIPKVDKIVGPGNRYVVLA